MEYSRSAWGFQHTQPEHVIYKMQNTKSGLRDILLRYRERNARHAYAAIFGRYSSSFFGSHTSETKNGTRKQHGVALASQKMLAEPLGPARGNLKERRKCQTNVRTKCGLHLAVCRTVKRVSSMPPGTTGKPFGTALAVVAGKNGRGVFSCPNSSTSFVRSRRLWRLESLQCARTGEARKEKSVCCRLGIR